jgi:hypothetical protein
MPDSWLDQPRNIVQSSPRDCWAATMEAWLEIVPGKTAWSQDELFLMAAEKGLVWDNDTLEMNALVKKGIPVIAKEVGKLSTKRHVYLVYHPPSAPDDLAHAVSATVYRLLETLKPGDTLHVKVLRDEKPVDLSMKWTGW